MGTRQGINKLPSHVAALPHHHHNSISDFSIDSISLSFAGLVSVKDQQISSSSVPNNQDERYSELSKLAVPEPPFEFATTNNKSVSNSASSPITRIRPADVLISNGKLVPQTLPPSQLPNRSFISSNNPQGSLRIFLASDHHQHHHNIRSNKMPKPKGETGKANRKYYEPLGKDKNEEIKSEKEEERRGIGKKVLNSFLAPCRECKAIQPGTSVKGGRETSSKYK